jgi:signal transduction histidine kinase
MILVARLDPGLVPPLTAALGLVLAGALAMGEADRRAAAAEAELHRRLASAEDDDRLRLHAAVVDQRALAARDLHDSLGHTISLIVLLAGAARLGRDFATSVAGVERAARTALAELDERVDATSYADPALPFPQCLQDLADDVRAAGTPVTLHTEGVDDLPPGVGRTVHLLVREALTNVLKHAAGAPTAVRVERSGNVVRVSVTNVAGPGDPDPLPSGSRGLAGMRERVALFGGRFDAGPDGNGGFVLNAGVPLPAVEAPSPVPGGVG